MNRNELELEVAPVPSFSPELTIVQMLSLVGVAAQVEVGALHRNPGKFGLVYGPTDTPGAEVLRVLVRLGFGRADVLAEHSI